MQLYLIRHADPDYETDSLTPAGRLEAAALAEELAGKGLTRIDCSTMGRARETASYTARKVGLSPNFYDGLRELDWHTELEGWGRLSTWDAPGEVIRASPQLEHQTLHEQFVSPFQEGLDKIRAFSDTYLEQLGYRRQGHRYQQLESNRHRIAIFCHGGFGLTWLAHLLGLPLPVFWCSFWLPPSSVSTIVFEERSSHWAVPRCLGLGDVSHLRMASLPWQARGLHGTS